MSNYGIGSATYNAAGGIEGIRLLVSDFYRIMDKSSDFASIRNMHSKDLETSIDKLSCFLSGWMGGESLYSQKYGEINIPQYHAFMKIGDSERDMWMSCMKQALNKQKSRQNYSESLV